MKRLITYVTVIDLIFLLMLVTEGTFENETARSVLHTAAFLIPISLGLYFIKRAKSTDFPAPHGVRGEMQESTRGDKLALGISVRGVRLALPVAIPTIAITSLISYLTSLTMEALGFVNNVNISGHFALAILVHALVPAILEELLFRYIPLKLIGGIGGDTRRAVMLSSLMFALGHANLFQIPYALAAGLAFAVCDLLCGSILPSVAIHFLNNLISLVMIYGYVTLPFYISFGVLLAASCIFLFLMRKSYYTGIKEIWVKKSSEGTAVVLTFIIPCAILAISALGAA